jgi:hypothetical protein
MSLGSGIYIISNKLDNAFVGRFPIEDRSLLPKKVVTLPAGFEAPQWDIEALSGNRYKLSTQRAPTSEIEGRLYAVLASELAPTEWTITKRDNHGPNIYTVEAPSGNGWVVANEEPETQIEVKPLIINPSFPPQFQPNALFTFSKAE